MSDYTTPIVSDKAVEKLADEIRDFYEECSKDYRQILENLDEIVTKHYLVTHEPQIVLPFEGEYQYIHDTVKQGSKTLDDFTHIFLSGYLPNGKTIHYNALEEDERGFTHSRYAAIYINGKQMYGDYTCRAEEGGWEKLNILIIGAPKMGSDAARLDVDYADIPLKDFKMVLYDDLEEPVYPDINSFLAHDIDTLKCIGNLRWTFADMCTLRRLEITKDIYPVSTMYMPCLQELIIPNVTNVPNINYVNSQKSGIVKLDISNVRGKVGNLASCNLNTDLILKASEVSNDGFSGCQINTLDMGSYCSILSNAAFKNATCTKVILGAAMSNVMRSAFEGCKNLWRVDFNNHSPVTLDIYSFYNDAELTDVNFSYLKSMISGAFSGCTSLTNLTFIPKSISCPLYFNISQIITEQSCLNIINAIADDATVAVSLHAAVKTRMSNEWYCKLSDGSYVSCTADDEGAVTQTAALIARGGTLA